MNKNSKWLLVGLSVLVFLFVAYAASSTAIAAAPQAKTLTIGSIVPLSGPAAGWGMGIRNGVALAVDEYNAKGGIKVGNEIYNLKGVAYDSKLTAVTSVESVTRALDVDKAKVIISLATVPVLAVLPVTNGAKVMQSSICASPKALDPKFPYSFRITPDVLFMTSSIYQFLGKNHPEIKKVAFINPNDESGKQQQTTSGAYAKQYGMEVVSSQFFERGATQDFVPILTKILASKPDGIDVGNMSVGESAVIVKQARELGYDKLMWTSIVISVQQWLGIAKESAEGFVCLSESEPTSALAEPAEKAFYDTYMKRFGAPFLTTASQGYNSVAIPVQAFEATGSIDPDKAMNWIKNNKFRTNFGSAEMIGEKTFGIKLQMQVPMYILQIKGGKPLTLSRELPVLP